MSSICTDACALTGLGAAGAPREPRGRWPVREHSGYLLARFLRYASSSVCPAAVEQLYALRRHTLWRARWLQCSLPGRRLRVESAGIIE